MSKITAVTDTITQTPPSSATSSHLFIGHLQTATEVQANKCLLETDRTILTGSVSPHSVFCVMCQKEVFLGIASGRIYDVEAWRRHVKTTHGEESRGSFLRM
jgi:nickel-dependent lactate racemase